MNADTNSPEQLNQDWRNIRALEKCAGWTEWMRPRIEERMAAIKGELVSELSAEVTAALRVEHRTLLGILRKPEQQRKVIEGKSNVVQLEAALA